MLRELGFWMIVVGGLGVFTGCTIVVGFLLAGAGIPWHVSVVIGFAAVFAYVFSVLRALPAGK